MHAPSQFFSRTAGSIVGALLLLILLLVAYEIGPIAIERWFGWSL